MKCREGGHAYWCGGLDQRACITHSTSVLCAHCFNFKSEGPPVPRYRRTEGGDRFSHNTVAVLEAFATSIVMLYRALDWNEDAATYDDSWSNSAYHWARSAVRAARMLTVREDYR